MRKAKKSFSNEASLKLLKMAMDIDIRDKDFDFFIDYAIAVKFENFVKKEELL